MMKWRKKIWIITIRLQMFRPEKNYAPNQVQYFKAGGGGAHHQAGTKPRGGHPAPQVL